MRYLWITEALRYSSLGCAGEAVRRHLGSLDGLKQKNAKEWSANEMTETESKTGEIM